MTPRAPHPCRPTSLSRRAFVVAALGAPFARALGRRPPGGTLRLDLPFSVARLDPHSATDPVSALLSTSIADSLFAWDGSGKPYAALAARMPERDSNGARVTLRPGLVTGGGRPLSAPDVVFSLERCRRRAARPLFSGWGEVRAVDSLTVGIPGGTPEAVADALASPTTAIVPRRFVADAPDGTGALRVVRFARGLALERNPNAARGASFLDRVEVRRAPDLATSLRSFESGDADIGFLGAGLHRPRSGAIDFRTASFGLLVLRTGPEAGPWGAPGVAATLVEQVDPARLAHLGLSSRGKGGAGTGFGGKPADLLVSADSPYLAEVARGVAAAISRPGHEITPRPVPDGDFRNAIRDRHFALALDFVRKIGPEPRHSALSLLSAADPLLGDTPPRVLPGEGALIRTLPLAVIGELALVGAHAPGIHGLESLDLGSVYRERG